MYNEAQSHDALAAIHEQFTRIKLLTSDLHNKDLTIGILQDKISELEQEIDQQMRSRQQLEQQFLMLQEEHTAMFETQSKKTKSLQLFNQQLLSALKEVQDKNQSLLERVQAQDVEIQQQQQGKVEIHQQLNLLRQGVADIEKDLQSSQKKNSLLKREKKDQLEQVRLLQSQLESTLSQEDQVKNLIQSCEQENHILRNEIQDTRKNLECQFAELVELRFFRKSHDEISKKYDDLVQNFNLNSLTCKKTEDAFREKIDEIKIINKDLERKTKHLEQDKRQSSTQIQLLEQQFVTQSQYVQDILSLLSQKFLLYKDTHLTTQRKSNTYSVHERLHENTLIVKGKKLSARKPDSSIKRNQSSSVKSTTNHLMTEDQIHDFFNQLEQFTIDLQEREKSNGTQNVSLKAQINELIQGSESLRMQLDDLNNANYAWKQESDKRHLQQNECLEAEAQEGWELYQKENIQAIQLKHQNQQLNERVIEQEQEIIELTSKCDSLRQNHENLNQEFDNLKQVFLQVQQDIEEILAKKSLAQNKLCLAYGFAQQLFKILIANNENGQKFNEMAKLANYSYYFASINAQLQIQRPSRQKRFHIYSRFRRVKNAIKFIKYLRQFKENKPKQSGSRDLQKLLMINFETQVTFSQSDQIDNLVEKYLPFFQQVSSSQQEQLMIDHKLSLELYQELIRSLYGKLNNTTHNQNSDFVQNIAQNTQKDLIIVKKLVHQEQYYEQHLDDLQKRVLQLDEYVKVLQEELDVQSSNQKQLIRDNINLTDRNKAQLQSQISPQVSTFIDNQPILSCSPIGNSRITIRQEEPLIKSTSLQSELASILSRKSNTQSRMAFSSDKKSIGRIVKQQ